MQKAAPNQAALRLKFETVAKLIYGMTSIVETKRVILASKENVVSTTRGLFYKLEVRLTPTLTPTGEKRPDTVWVYCSE